MKCFILAGFVCVASFSSEGAEVVDYAKGVLPIMKERCWSCHSNEKEVKGSLALDDFDEVRDYQIGKYNIIRPGNVAESGFYERLTLDSTHTDFMPRKGSPLPKPELEVIEKWIVQGAIIDVSKMTPEEEKRFAEAKSASAPGATPLAGDGFHQWTNLAGRVIEAKLLSIDEDSVKLQLRNGKNFDVMLKDLSRESIGLAKELGEP